MNMAKWVISIHHFNDVDCDDNAKSYLTPNEVNAVIAFGIFKQSLEYHLKIHLIITGNALNLRREVDI